MVHVALSLHPKQSMRLQLSYSENLSAVIKEEMLKDRIGRSRKHIWLKRLKWNSHFNKEWNQGYMNGKKEHMERGSSEVSAYSRELSWCVEKLPWPECVEQGAEHHAKDFRDSSVYATALCLHSPCTEAASDAARRKREKLWWEWPSLCFQGNKQRG